MPKPGGPKPRLEVISLLLTADLRSRLRAAGFRTVEDLEGCTQDQIANGMTGLDRFITLRTPEPCSPMSHDFNRCQARSQWGQWGASCNKKPRGSVKLPCLSLLTWLLSRAVDQPFIEWWRYPSWRYCCNGPRVDEGKDTAHCLLLQRPWSSLGRRCLPRQGQWVWYPSSPRSSHSRPDRLKYPLRDGYVHAYRWPSSVGFLVLERHSLAFSSPSMSRSLWSSAGWEGRRSTLTRKAALGSTGFRTLLLRLWDTSPLWHASVHTWLNRCVPGAWIALWLLGTDTSY